MRTISQEFAKFICGLSYDALPGEVKEKAKTLLLHNIGVGLAAYDTETAQVAIGVAKKLGAGNSTILVEGSRVYPLAAALANGAIIHSRAQEDNYKRGSVHLGVIVIPAALAVGEEVAASGKEIITALVAGYEVGCRLSRDYCRISTKRGFRSSTLYGPSAAAGSVAKLFHLNTEQTASALGWGVNLSGGLLQTAIDKTSEMAYQAGLAAQNGITAAMMGQAGAIVAEGIYEGQCGLYRAFVESGLDLGPVLNGLGSEYVMLDTLLKPYPVGGGVQTATSVMLDLTLEHNIDPDGIEEVTVWMYPPEAGYPGANVAKPGLVSGIYCCAVAGVFRKLTLETVDQSEDPRVLSLMQKIKVVPDDSLQSMSARLQIKMKDGRAFRKDAHLTFKDYCYSFEKDAQLIRSLIPEMGLPADQVERVIEKIHHLESCGDIRDLIKMLVFPGKKATKFHRLLC